MDRKLRIAASVLFGLLTVVIALACGAGAFVAAATTLMSLGLKYHGNYEYYGFTPAVYVVYLAGALGFTAPLALVAWRLNKQGALRGQPRFSLRTFLIVTTLSAIVLGFIARMVR